MYHQQSVQLSLVNSPDESKCTTDTERQFIKLNMGFKQTFSLCHWWNITCWVPSGPQCWALCAGVDLLFDLLSCATVLWSCVNPKCTSEIWLTMPCDHIMILSSRVITVLMSDACKGLHAEQSCRTVQLTLFTYPVSATPHAMWVSICTVASLVWLARSLRTTWWCTMQIVMLSVYVVLTEVPQMLAIVYWNMPVCTTTRIAQQPRC